MFLILAGNKKGPTNGAFILFRMDSSSFQSIDMAYLTRVVYSLPLRLVAFSLVSRTSVPASVEAQIIFCDQVIVHDSGTWVEIVADLETFGMRKENLPKHLDGAMDLTNIVQWPELRTRMEFQLPHGRSGINTSFSDVPGMRQYSELSEQDRTERRRRSNVVNCRRKRDRVRVQQEQECADLASEQERM